MFNYGIFDANVSACKESLLTLSINERAKITDALHGELYGNENKRQFHVEETVFSSIEYQIAILCMKK